MTRSPPSRAAAPARPTSRLEELRPCLRRARCRPPGGSGQVTCRVYRGEVRVAQLQRGGARRPPAVTQLAADVHRARPEQAVQLAAVADVAAERLLARDALGALGNRHLTVVDAPGAFDEAGRACSPRRRRSAATGRPRGRRGWPGRGGRGPSPRRVRAPGSRRSGRGARKAASAPGGTTTIPRGFSRSDATLATIFEVATPHDASSVHSCGDAVAQLEAPCSRARPCARSSRRRSSCRC